MSKSIKKNYIYNLIYNIFLLIFPVVVTPYVARVLSENGSGQYSYAHSIATYFTLIASMGFNTYAQRLLASHQGDIKQQSIDFFEVLIARLVPVLVTLILYYNIVSVNLFGERHKQILIILAIDIIAVMFDIAFFFQGNEEFGKLTVRNILIKLIGIIAVFSFVKNETHLLLYTLIQSLTILLANLSLWVYIPTQVCKVKIKELRPFKHLKASFILFIPTIAASLYAYFDKTMIGLITKDDSENGNYEYAEKLVKMSMAAFTSLGAVMIPRNSRKIAIGDKEGVIQNIYTTARFVLLLGIPISFGICAISDNFIPWYLGDGYDKTATLMKLLSPIVVIIGLSNVFGLQFMVPSGMEKKFTKAILCGTFTNISINLIMIRLIGSYGAAIATVISELVVTLVMLYQLRRDISSKIILGFSVRYLIAGIVMYIMCIIVATRLISSIINTVMIVLIGIGIYSLMLCLMKDDLFSNIIRKIRFRMKG